MVNGREIAIRHQAPAFLRIEGILPSLPDATSFNPQISAPGVVVEGGTPSLPDATSFNPQILARPGVVVEGGTPSLPDAT